MKKGSDNRSKQSGKQGIQGDKEKEREEENKQERNERKKQTDREREREREMRDKRKNGDFPGIPTVKSQRFESKS